MSTPLAQPAGSTAPAGGLPVRLLHDRVLVAPRGEGERSSKAGILIPATAQMGRRLAWGEVVGIGTNVRLLQNGDRVLFDPEDKAEVELHASTYVLLRERDVHAVAAERIDDAPSGLYL